MTESKSGSNNTGTKVISESDHTSGLPRIDETSFDLNVIYGVLREHWRPIVLIPFCAALIAAGLSLLIANVYRAEVLLAPVSLDENAASSLGGIGDLAALAGISMRGGGDKDENLAVLKSREFIWTFVHEQDLMPKLFQDEWDSRTGQWRESDPDKQPTLWDAYRLFDGKILNVSDDRQTGLVRVSIVWRNPGDAAKWGNLLVQRLNEFLRESAIARSEKNLTYLNSELANIQVAEMRMTLYQLIAKEQRTAMLANTQEEFAFRVLDHAATPDKKHKPNRALVVIFVAFLAGVLTVTFILLRYILRASTESDSV